jgi:RNA polymerase sigma-70 factor (ECF subfamily)
MEPVVQHSELTSTLSQRDVEVLYKQYHRQVYALAWALLRSEEEALDAVQEAFVKVLRASDRFEGRSTPYSWLYRIVTNVCLDRRRKRRRSREVELNPRIEQRQAAPPTSACAPAEAFESGQLRQALATSLQRLSREHRSVIVMRELQGLTYEQMARRSDCPQGTIMSRLFHARRKLRTLLDEADWAAAGT